MQTAAKQQDALYQRMTKARQVMPARGRGRKREEPIPPSELLAKWNKLPPIKRLNALRASLQRQTGATP